MVLGIIVSLISLGLLIALMFNIVILALPLFAGLAASRFAYETGAGAFGVIVVGFLAGAAALGLAQVLLVMTRSTLVRLPIALAFAAPAALAGYHLVLAFSQIGGAHGVWEHFFAGVGAIAIGIASLKRRRSFPFSRHAPGVNRHVQRLRQPGFLPRLRRGL